MTLATILTDAIFIAKFEWRHFNYQHNKIEFYLSIFFTLICSGIHRITEVFEGSLYAIKMGFPFPWMEKYINYEELLSPMNYSEISSINYQIAVFALNCFIFYCFMIGIKRLFYANKWISDKVSKY